MSEMNCTATTWARVGRTAKEVRCQFPGHSNNRHEAWVGGGHVTWGNVAEEAIMQACEDTRHMTLLQLMEHERLTDHADDCPLAKVQA